jgi:hypothetical protein
MKDYISIGVEVGLASNRLMNYVIYMGARWPGKEEENCSNGIAEQWAKIWLQGNEFEKSDLEGKKILRNTLFGYPNIT